MCSREAVATVPGVHKGNYTKLQDVLGSMEDAMAPGDSMVKERSVGDREINLSTYLAELVAMAVTALCGHVVQIIGRGVA
jgi:hypothetical protein